MLININTSDTRPIYVQIMDEIRRAIVLETLRAEDPIPSVRQLAMELRVNPNTVAQAYRELERAGIVYVRRGQGTFVSPGAPTEVERRSLVEGVAARALTDAHRHGIGIEELIEAIRQTANERDINPATAEHV
jgi:GntR family transcriptional regulator